MGELIEAKAERLPVQTTPGTLLELAITQGADLDRLERLMQMQEAWEQKEARKAYTRAMTLAKANMPIVEKDRTVSYASTSYRHASLAAVVDAAVSALSANGLSHSWSVHQDGEAITVTCAITHEEGHSESVQMFAGPDKSGQKNAIQSIASTVQYLQRYTLMAICGMASKEMDDDGRGASHAPSEEAQATADNLVAQIVAAKTIADLKPLSGDAAKAALPGTLASMVRSAYLARTAALKKDEESV